MRIVLWIAILTTALGLFTAERPARAQQDTRRGIPVAAIGDAVPEHVFPKLDRHDGRTKLSELYGHPVLVVGWRQRLPEGIHGVWEADQLAKKFADDGLIVILKDRFRWTESRWWGARSFWVRGINLAGFNSPAWFSAGEPGRTEPLPIERKKSARDDRSFVLIGVDGTLLIEDRIEESWDKERKGDVRRRVRAAIKEEIRRRKNGWGEDRHLKRARALAFGKGAFAEAAAALEKSAIAPEAKAAARARIDDALAAQIACVHYAIERGRLLDARSRWKALRRATRRNEAMSARVEPLAAHFKGADFERALKAARRLEKILKPIESGDWRSLDLDSLLALRRVAERNQKNNVGHRAARLDPLVRDLVRIACRISPTKMDAAIEKRRAKQR